jgi:nitroreductase
MAESPDVFGIICTTRAMRRLKPDPVPDELIRKVVEAGVCAANGAKRQTWRFLVIKDRAIKERVQHFISVPSR